MKKGKETLREQGCRFFRQNIILATLSGTPVEITNIRTGPEHPSPGLKEHEANFLKLIDSMTTGCRIEVSPTGDSVKYVPGAIIGGTFTHQCNRARGIGYYLEAIVCLAPFAKLATDVTLVGVTNAHMDVGVDIFRTVTIPLLKKFGINAAFVINARGSAPCGGGKVNLKIAPVRQVAALAETKPGKIWRVRGIAYATRVSPELASRSVTAAKGMLLKLLPDVWITTDARSGEEAGLSPGYGICLVAEGEGVNLSQEYVPSEADMKEKTAEDVGQLVAKLLFEEIHRGGCVDTTHQALALLLMALGPEELTSVLVGELTEYGENMVTLIEKHFGVQFSTKRLGRKQLPPLLRLSCIGCNFVNAAKRSA